MFTFRVSEYTNQQSANKTAEITTVKTTGTYFGIPFSLAKTEQNVNAVVPTNTAGLVTAALPTGLSLEIVYYEGQTLRGDEFTYDKTTGLLSFSTESTTNGNSLTYLTTDIAKLRTAYTCETISAFLKQYKVEGTITQSESFGGQPTLAVSFQVNCDQQSQVENDLCPGLEKLVLGNWRILGVTTRDNNTNKLQVDIRFGSVWAPYNDPSLNPLDEAVGLKNGNAKFRTAAELAGEVGVNLVGPEIKIRIPRNVSSQDFTTLREEIEARAIIENSYVDYNDPTAVRIKQFGQGTIHVINDSDVFDINNNSISTDYSGAGATVNGVKLSNELRNVLLELDFDTEQQSGQVCRYEFVNCNSIFEATLAARPKGVFDGPGEILFQPDADLLQSNARNYDTGAWFKQWAKIQELDGLPLEIEQHTYCFLYSSIDTYNIAGTNFDIITFDNTITPQSFWVEVSFSKTYFVYDSDGYLVRAYTNGTQAARLRQETEDNEAVTFLAQALQVGLDLGDIPNSPAAAISLYNQSQAYVWNQELPITDETNYTLRLLRDFYPDIELPQDDDFVEPKFAERKLRFRRDFFVGENPDSTDTLELAPIIVEKVTDQEERQIVTSSDFPERFNRKSQTLNQEGPGGINATRESRLQQVLGRPPIHTRLEVNAQPQDNTSLQNYFLYKDNRYWVTTPNSGSTFEFTEDTISFPDVDDPEVARAATQTLYRILNSQNAQPVTTTIRYRPNIKIGDTVIFRNRKYYIFDKTTVREIDYLNFNGLINLSLGRAVDLIVDLTEVKNIAPPAF